MVSAALPRLRLHKLLALPHPPWLFTGSRATRAAADAALHCHLSALPARYMKRPSTFTIEHCSSQSTTEQAAPQPRMQEQVQDQDEQEEEQEQEKDEQEYWVRYMPSSTGDEASGLIHVRRVCAASVPPCTVACPPTFSPTCNNPAARRR